MTKTAKIYLKDKDSLALEACGSCFCITEEKDQYCWYCGAYFETVDYGIYSFKELAEFYKKMTE